MNQSRRLRKYEYLKSDGLNAKLRLLLQKANFMKKAMLGCLLVLISGLGILQPTHAIPAVTQTIKAPSNTANQQVEVEAENIALARKLIEAFYTYLAATGSPTGTIGKPTIDDTEARNKVKTLLDQDVLIQRADGDFFDYSSYYPIDIDDYTVSNIKVTRPRPELIVATYDISTPNATSLTRGLVNSADYTPRLTTFRYNQELQRWLILSHANFNNPIQQICNHPSINLAPSVKRSDENLAIQRLVYTLIKRLYNDVRSRGEAIAHKGGLITKQTQVMSGDGYKRTGASGARSIKVGPTEKRGFVVSNGDNDLVVRFEAKNKSRIGGIEFTDEWQPRLATFSRNSKGQWELASYALFNYPISLPEGAKCINEK
jgi:hypothetical protein